MNCDMSSEKNCHMCDKLIHINIVNATAFRYAFTTKALIKFGCLNNHVRESAHITTCIIVRKSTETGQCPGSKR